MTSNPLPRASIDDVPHVGDLCARIADRLREPLPGLAAQLTMARPGRIPPDYNPTPQGARPSAVLLIITPALELIFIRRTEDGRTHSGQIAFPGGGREGQDADLTETALREAEEEIGVARESVRVLGHLTPFYIPVTNYSIQPVVGAVDTDPELIRQPDEVDDTFKLPIAGFEASRGELLVARHDRSYWAPCYRFGEVEVWGATAMITAEFLQVWGEIAGEVSA